MRALNDKEISLVKLAVLEGIDTITSRLWVDFRLSPKKLTVHQSERLNQLQDLLYTLFIEATEDHGALQSEYDHQSII